MEKKNYRAVATTASVLLAIAVVVAGLWRMSALYLGTHLARAAYLATPFAATVLAPVATIVAIAVLAYQADVIARKKLRVVANVGLVVAVLLSGLWLVQGVRWTNRYNVETRGALVANLEVSALGANAYAARMPVPQARIALQSAVSGVAGEVSDVTYVANGPRGAEFCATVERGDGTLGRVFMREVMCFSPETGVVTTAEFTGKVGTLSGWWSSKLADQVASVRRGLVFSEQDVYGYITSDGEARLVVPVKFATGEWNRRYNVPAGVVLFDADGTRTYVPEIAPGEIPGPVLGMSIAEEVRGAVNAVSGDLRFWHNPKRNPEAVQRTNEADGEEAADPNGENPSEFVLLREDGRLVYVTPLTPWGKATTVVAYLEVYADEVTAGEVPEAVLHRFDGERIASNTLIAQRVTSLYGNNVTWAAENNGGAEANGSRIFEITPTDPGFVELVVGVGSQAQYRVRVDARMNDANEFGEVCVFDADSGEQIRCDGPDTVAVPVGALAGLGGRGSGSETSSGETSSGVDLSGVSTRELLEEIERRIGEG